jgi:hypothetical protein
MLDLSKYRNKNSKELHLRKEIIKNENVWFALVNFTFLTCARYGQLYSGTGTFHA